MNLSPFLAQDRDLAGQLVLDPVSLGSAKSVALPQFRRASRTVEDEHRFAIRADYLDMLRSMISRATRARSLFQCARAHEPPDCDRILVQALVTLGS
jgi:hypothetical protein